MRNEMAMPAIMAPDNTPTAIFHNSVILLSSCVYFSVYTKVFSERFCDFVGENNKSFQMRCWSLAYQNKHTIIKINFFLKAFYE